MAIPIYHFRKDVRNVLVTPQIRSRFLRMEPGQVDMLRAMQTYRDVGFPGPFMMDHTPEIPHPSGSWAGHAYANGYIRALIQAVYR